MSLDLHHSTWTRVRFGDVVKNLNETVREPEAVGVDRVIAMEHLDPGELKIVRWGEIANGTTFTRRVRPGQTLFGKRRAYQRKAALADFDAVCSGDILVFEADPQRLLPALLPFLVQSEGFFNHALSTSAGSLSPRTNWKALSKYEFDLPPLDEQEGIASLLWSGAALMPAQERVAACIDATLDQFCLKAFAEAQSRGVLRPFPEIAELRMGRQKAPKYMAGDSPTSYLSVANIGRLELDLGFVQAMDFSPSEVEKFRLEPGDIVLTEGDIVSPLNVGRPALISEGFDECCFQNTLIRIRPGEELDPMFVLAVLEGMRLAGFFAAAASTTTVTHLGLRRLAALRFPVVSPASQMTVREGLAELLAARAASRDAYTMARELMSALRGRLS